MLTKRRGFYSVAEDEGTARIALDTTSGFGPSRRSMRFAFPDRSNDLVNRCHDYTIGRKEGNTIRLTERNVSRAHAKIRKNVNGAIGG